jgi:hypothetical protein
MRHIGSCRSVLRRPFRRRRDHQECCRRRASFRRWEGSTRHRQRSNARTKCTSSGSVRLLRYNDRVPEPRRDEFPNNFVGDLVATDRGWVVVPTTCCPAGHDYGDEGWSVSSVWCICNGRHTAWRCACGAVLYAPQPGPHCRIRDRGPVSMHERPTLVQR